MLCCAMFMFVYVSMYRRGGFPYLDGWLSIIFVQPPSFGVLRSSSLDFPLSIRLVPSLFRFSNLSIWNKIHVMSSSPSSKLAATCFTLEQTIERFD